MLNKDEIRQLMELVAGQKLSAKDALSYFHAGTAPSGAEISGRLKPDEIAVVGISGRFPDADTVDEFWSNLASAKDSVRELSKERFDITPYYDPDSKVSGKTISKWGAQLSGIDKFDPLFFNISTLQAEYMEPRQRVFLEETWKALEDACLSDRNLRNKKCAVFVGCEGSTDYFHNTDAELCGEYFLGNSNSILAARISYFLDLKGPSVTVDTACSSSLVAIHLACESLRNLESEVAIAGGIQIMNRPVGYVLLSKLGVLSPTDKSKVFDDSADGIIPGEAAGVVVLKRLQDAIKSGDHIYGVIAGSGINQDGKTNGITSPSSNAQTQLEYDIYDKFGINPEYITYVETHGTGTPLGDPIEIEALTNTFRKYTQKKHYCTIGSVKTNIGHAFAAAGISGFIKILLCFKHQQIPPSLHFSKPNRYIDFDNSPFFVNTALTDWIAHGGSPRMAAISSFGHSGTNGHIIIREHSTREADRFGTIPYYMMVLSAKTEEALRSMRINLAKWLEMEGEGRNIGDIACSLLVGRSCFPFRYAFVVENLPEMQQKLEEAGRAWVHYSSPFPDGISGPNSVTATEQGKALLEELCAGNQLPGVTYKKKLTSLAGLFMSGCELPYENLYKDRGYRFVSLPKYPFAGEHYWIAENFNSKRVMAAPQPPRNMRHPLVGENISTFTECKFATSFTGEEYLLKDHRMNGKMTLPGAAIIEMAIAAASLAEKTKLWRTVSNVKWMRPLVSEKSELEVCLSFEKLSDERVLFEAHNENGGVRDIFASGELEAGSNKASVPITPPISVAEFINRCHNTFGGEECYSYVSSLGADFGLRFRGLKRVWVNNREAVGKVELPDRLMDGNESFLLHPVLLDGAFQVVIGFLLSSKKTHDSLYDPVLYLPYSLGRLTIYNAIPGQCYVYMTSRQDLAAKIPLTPVFDLLIISEEGDVVAKVEDYALARLASVPPLERADQNENVRLFSPVWVEKMLDTGEEAHPENHPALLKEDIIIFDTDVTLYDSFRECKDKVGRAGGTVLVKPGGKFRRAADFIYELNPADEKDFEALIAELRVMEFPVENIVYLWPLRMDAESAHMLQLTYVPVFLLCQTLIKMQNPAKVRFMYVYPNSGTKKQVFDAAMSAFALTLRQENPSYLMKTIELPLSGMTPAPDISLIGVLLEEMRHEDDGFEIRYKEGKRYVKTFSAIPETQEAFKAVQNTDVYFKDSGVYIITGGLGGVGSSIAGYITENVKVRLILTGRSEMSAEVSDKLKILSAKGSEVIYVTADCSVREEVDSLVKMVKGRFGAINGIIHTAGIISDSYIINKTPEEFSMVSAPKVSGTINFDEALKDEKIDFFIMFSSLTSVFGNIGQSDYAYANGFMDSFAHFREHMRLRGERSGKTLSINWPYWKNGGMPVSDLLVQWMKERYGITPMDSNQGFNVLKTAMAMAVNQVAVLPFFVGQEKDPFTTEKATEWKYGETQPESGQGKEWLRKQTEQFLKEIISSQIKIPAERLNSEKTFENYGIDSMAITRFNYELDKTIPGLSKTLFFEYRNLKTLTDYFMDHHETALTGLFKSNEINPPGDIREPAVVIPKEDNKDLKVNSPLFSNIPIETGYTLPAEDEIAIIGVDGRYPMAENLDEFWENLKQGRDCITEIPGERWDHTNFYDPDKGKRGSVYSKWGGFINGVDEFDPVFFRIAPREAELIDPQERLFLQCAYHTLEDAGYTAATLQTQQVGVFVGVMYGQYQLYSIGDAPDHVLPLSSSYASIANRVSYFFDLRGPSVALDSMCSSSLTAIHMACQSIRNGDCDLALAGGVNVTIHPAKYVLLCAQKFASSDGRCRSFGEGGDGYVPGEGVGAVLLKPLSKAIRDNDNIYAVVKSSTVNHCGKTNGYTVPDPNQQGALIARAFQRSSLSPGSIGYIEAHGTGTSLGDPLEISGLTKAYELTGPPVKVSCPIGSVKSNIGHLESAAGIAAVTKVLLMMKYKKLAPSIHSGVFNPNINFHDSYFYVQQTLEDWRPKEIFEGSKLVKLPRRAGISSFGAGGSNAHVILEEYEAPNDLNDHLDTDRQMIILSAVNSEQLKQKAAQLADFLLLQKGRNHPSFTLRNLAFTLQVGREAMKYRLAFVAGDLNVVIGQLQKFVKSDSPDETIFTGAPGGNAPAVPDDHRNLESEYENELRRLVRTKDLTGLAGLWVLGVNINWEDLYSGSRPRRITLPAHPFLKKRYWFDSYVQNLKDEPEVVKSTGKAPTVFNDDWKRLAGEFTGSEVTCTIIDGSIALVQMQDKINKNMFTKGIVGGLVNTFDTLRRNEAIKVIVVTGYENIFCMGGTQESLLAIAEKKAQFTDIPFLYKGLLETEIPVITAIQGHAFGGGLLFGLYGDMVVMAEEGLYCANFMNFGFTPGMGATFILDEKLGGIASEMMFTGKTYRGEEISKRGCSSVIFTSRENVVNEALNVAHSLSKKPRKSLQVLKKHIAGKVLAELDKVMEQEIEMHELTFGGSEVKQKIDRHFGRGR